MNAVQFVKVLDEQVTRTYDILASKAAEYADDEDRLHNFKAAASLLGTSPMKALAGLMSKHTVSIYDMVSSGEFFPLEKWDEKITDHINYLVLLRALIIEGDIEDAALGTGGTT